jgi:hypothetical protein
MRKQINNFLKSFIPNRKHLTSFFTDAITIGLLLVLLISFSNVLETKATDLLQGQDTAEELQAYFLTAPAEELEAYVGTIQGFVAIFIIGMIVFLALFLILFSLSRSLLWHNLLDKKFTFKKFWRWNLLNLFILVIGFIYAMVFLILKSIFMIIVTMFNVVQLTLTVDYVLNFFALIIFLIILFFTYSNFTKEYKVFKSISFALKELKHKWTQIWPVLIGAFIVASVITIVLYLIGVPLQYYATLLLIINFIITFLFITWFRLYLLKVTESKT